jgi:HTH-type transcriptional regulator/antitoxin HigA
LPRVIESREDLERLAREIEPLLDKAGPSFRRRKRNYAGLVLKLIGDYQRERHLVPGLKPHELLQALLEASGMRQADLLSVFGSRSRVSDAVNGKRGISREQAKRLGELFHLSPAAFFLNHLDDYQRRVEPEVEGSKTKNHRSDNCSCLFAIRCPDLQLCN